MNEFLKQTKYLNNAQKKALEKEIANLNWQNQNLLKNQITLLDQAMQTYNNIQTIDTNNINYSQADLDLKQAYDKALNNQKQTLNKTTGNNLDLNQVNQAINELKNAINNLNGNVKVNKQKELIKNKINQEYQALTNKQKDKALETIIKTDNLEILKQLDIDYQNINNLMKELRNNLQNNSSIIIDNNYYDATKNIKDSYDQMIISSKKLFDQLHTINDNLLNESILKSNNEKFRNVLNKLDGKVNLELSKNNANSVIDKLENYSNEEKITYKKQIKNAQNIQQVNSILNQLLNSKKNNKYKDILLLIILITASILTIGLVYFAWLLVKRFNNK
ncbi:FIVAR domain-containing protein [Mycoplasma sp. 1018B]|uniref:FIVAR domain-containing protein n=1 Tax=Mycoplasma sp. 1018B TaxID=2967302 RepID=UPI0035931088